MFSIGEEVIYTYIKFGTIEQIHYDDAPNLYYTIGIPNTNRHPQTTSKNLQMIKKVGKLEPFDKGDKILYVKNINTQISDINNDSKEPLYKIYFIDDYKYVKAKKINKI